LYRFYKMSAQKPLCTVSLHCFPCFFTRHESDFITWALPIEDYKIRRMPYLVGAPIYIVERFCLRNAFEMPDRSDNLYRQSFSSFCPTCIDYFATVFRFHTSAKTVGSFSRCIVGLISTFHHRVLLYKLNVPRLIKTSI